MPNYCLNRATIRHKEPAQLKRLLKAYSRGGPGVGQEFLPPPAGCDERNWRICYWGTKWDFSEETFGRAAESVHGVVRLAFDTANTPPLGIYLELLRQGFELEAMYWEPGFGLCGRVDGTVVRDFELQSHDIQEIRKHVDAAIIEAFRMEEYYSDGEEQVYDTDPSKSSCDPWEEQVDLASFVAERANSRAVALKVLDEVVSNS